MRRMISDAKLKSLENKQDKLTAGQNITIENNVISATGGSGSVAWGQITGTLADQADLKDKTDELSYMIGQKASSNALDAVEMKADNNTAAITSLTTTVAGKQNAITSAAPLSSTLVEVQDVFSETLTVKNALATLKNGKQDNLTAGSGITIENNVISATGGGGSASWVEKGTYTLATTGQDFLTYQLDDDKPSSLTLAGKMCYIEVYSNDSGLAWSSTPFILDQTRCGTFICDGAEAEYFTGMNGLSISFLAAAGQDPEKVEIKFTQSYGAEETGTDYVTIYCYE